MATDFFWHCKILLLLLYVVFCTWFPSTKISNFCNRFLFLFCFNENGPSKWLTQSHSDTTFCFCIAPWHLVRKNITQHFSDQRACLSEIHAIETHVHAYGHRNYKSQPILMNQSYFLALSQFDHFVYFIFFSFANFNATKSQIA